MYNNVLPSTRKNNTITPQEVIHSKLPKLALFHPDPTTLNPAFPFHFPSAKRNLGKLNRKAFIRCKYNHS